MVHFILLVLIDLLSLVDYNYSLTKYDSLIKLLILSCSRSGFGNLTKLIVVQSSLLNFVGYTNNSKCIERIHFDCHLALSGIGRLQFQSWESVSLRIRSHASTLSVDTV